MIRAQRQVIIKDLEKKMVLLMGPRQSGKTWLAKEIASSFQKSSYFNYDNFKDKAIIEKQAWLPDTEILIFDELHKMPNWKNFLKGVFDKKPNGQKILVTGSASLEIYDHMGDSLAGRYFRHRLLPISLSELRQASEDLQINKLLERGGFPEPYFAESDLEAARWRMQYIGSLLSSDILEIEVIHSLKNMKLVLELLRNRVGSPVSYLSIAEDVGISPTTVKKYIQILEAVYVIFVVTPYARDIARSLKKEPKIYFFDNGLVNGDAGAKFENLVAISLLKSLYARNDELAEDVRLHYLRTKEGYEVDFAIVNGNKVESIIEAKVRDDSISKPLKYFHKKYSYQAIQLVQFLPNEYRDDGILVLDAKSYLAELHI